MSKPQKVELSFGTAQYPDIHYVKSAVMQTSLYDLDVLLKMFHMAPYLVLQLCHMVNNIYLEWSMSSNYIFFPFLKEFARDIRSILKKKSNVNQVVPSI